MVLNNKLSEFSIALQHLRSEKKHVELELELKNREIEDLKAAKEDMERKLEGAEVDKRQKEESQKHRVEQLEKEVKEDAERITRQLDDLQDQLQASQQREIYLEGKSIEKEADKERLKSPLAELEMDKNHLQTLLEELSASQNANDGKVVSDCVQHQRFTRKWAIRPLKENLAVGNENTAPSTPLRIPQGSKRGHSDLSENARHLPDLDLTKKIKTNLVNAAQEQTDQEEEDFRPEGLPELVQKGALVHNY